MIAEKIIPEGFQTMARAVFDRETAETLLSALREDPKTSIRINRRKSPDAAGLFPDTTPVEWCASGCYLPQRPQFTFDPRLHAGAYYVQDASSMVYETIVKELAGDTPAKAADLCAAPGGKTTAMLNALPAGSVVLANEFVAARARILKENLTKYGYPGTVVTNSEPSRLAAMRNYFDIVAVDAPCSGEGMMRKEEAARAQWSEGLVRQCAALQREILESAAEITAPGGYLIYSTCTFNPTEDEDNAAWIAETLGFEPVDTGLAGKYGIKGAVKGNIPCLRFMPGFTEGEGLFVAVFRKPGEQVATGSAKKNKKQRKNDKSERQQKPDRKLLDTAATWLDGKFELRMHDTRLLALDAATAALLDTLPQGVRIISAGVEAAEIKGKDLVPSHQLAMSACFSEGCFPDVVLDRGDALRYLARETVTLPEGTPKGYVTVSYEGHILGFIKHLGTRSNNLYPQDYRIRTMAPQ